MVFFPYGAARMGELYHAAGGSMGSDEKKALKKAKAAERAFRASKGYAPDTLWGRLTARSAKRKQTS